MWLAEQNSHLWDTAWLFQAISAFLRRAATMVVGIPTHPDTSTVRELGTGNRLLPAPQQKGFLAALYRG